MTDQQILELIEKEFEEKSFGVVKQYLDIHSPVLIDNKIKIDRIDREKNDGVVIAYIPVIGERFHFAVYLDSTSKEITGFSTEAFHRVYFRATSENFSSEELKSFTFLSPTKFWNKGDLWDNGKSRYTFSNFTIEPNPEPDEFEDKLKKLLTILEQDKSGIKRLVEEADGYIQVATDFHNANGMLGGFNLDKETIKRMSDLNLSIDFDLYVNGNSFKENS